MSSFFFPRTPPPEPRREGLSFRVLAPLLLFLCSVAATAAGPWPAPPEPGARAVLPGGEVLTLEVADDPLERWRGLRGREALPEGRGMLFVFPEDGRYHFVMEDCLAPLDILWLDRLGRVTHLETELPPCPEGEESCPTWVSPGPSRFVLELRSGAAAALGLKKGSIVLLDLGPGAIR